MAMAASTTGVAAWLEPVEREFATGLFIVRTVLSTLLALGIAFRFDLTSPGSAAVTVALISLPQTGMVLEKSFYRLLGTLLGAIVTLVLVAALAQHEFAFIAAVALWVAACTAASWWFRTLRAYAWLLCGYTTCLIGFPAFLDAVHAFDIAVDRVTIVSVGILSAGVVNAVFLPNRSTARLDALLKRALGDLPGFVDAALAAESGAEAGAAVHRSQIKLAADLAELEQVRMSSAFEDPRTRLRGPRIMLYTEALMTAFSQLELLRRLNRSDPAQAVSLSFSGRLATALDPIRGDSPSTEGARTAAARVDGLRQAALAQLQGMSATMLVLHDTLAAIREVLESYCQIEAPSRPLLRQPHPRVSIAVDGAQAALTAARAALALAAAVAFWIGSRWPDGMLSCVFAAVICALLAAHPEPRAAAWQMCKGVFLSVPATILCYGYLLPLTHDFPVFALVLTPFIGVGAWLMTRPGGALLGTGFLLVFLMSMNITAVMTYDIAGMLNGLAASVLGFLIALAAIVVIAPVDPAWRARRLASALLASLRIARQRPLPHARPRFEHQVRDFTAQLVAAHRGGALRMEDEALSAAVLAIGDSVIRLREHADLDAASMRPLAAALDAALAAAIAQNWRLLSASLATLAGMRHEQLEGRAACALGAVETALAGLIEEREQGGLQD